MPALQPQKPWGHATERVAEPPVLRLATGDTGRGRAVPLLCISPAGRAQPGSPTASVQRQLLHLPPAAPMAERC